MKILLINGSPRENGNTTRALAEMEQIFLAQGFECETIRVGNREIRGCSGCGSCYKNGKCVFDDLVNEVAQKFEQADGLVIGSPVYYASANGTLIAFLDRLFYSTPFDQLNKYFTVSGMPVASGSYWNGVHGAKAGECEQDAEGLQTMRSVAQNMAFLIKSIDLGKKTYGLPEKEKKIRTNFVR